MPSAKRSATPAKKSLVLKSSLRASGSLGHLSVKELAGDFPVLPCPFCGSKKIYAGRHCSHSCEAKCQICRARIVIDMPFDPVPIPPGVWKGKKWSARMDRLEAYTIRLCKESWNRRFSAHQRKP